MFEYICPFEYQRCVAWTEVPRKLMLGTVIVRKLQETTCREFVISTIHPWGKINFINILLELQYYIEDIEDDKR